jgi:signal transduction histidine kinase
MGMSPETERRLRRALVLDGVPAGLLSLMLIVIWAATTRGYFWPAWPLSAFAFLIAVHLWWIVVRGTPDLGRYTLGNRKLAKHAGISTSLALSFVLAWALTGGGPFWPGWTLFGLAVAVLAHAGVVLARRELGWLDRIHHLEETRAGAVDVQETELRRIERDLHDGAQARLVALGMSIGMAEEKLRTDPEAARLLLADARTGAREALEELRDLARGIRPPILTDRGLEAAIAALAARGPLPVDLSVDVPDRPPAAVETAAYFVVAEALANAIKHADATRVGVTVRHSDGMLFAEVGDDGRGGADPAGNGLRGLRQRVAALDGRLEVESPEGGPTTVRAELPCA